MGSPEATSPSGAGPRLDHRSLRAGSLRQALGHLEISDSFANPARCVHTMSSARRRPAVDTHGSPTASWVMSGGTPRKPSTSRALVATPPASQITGGQSPWDDVALSQHRYLQRLHQVSKDPDGPEETDDAEREGFQWGTEIGDKAQDVGPSADELLESTYQEANEPGTLISSVSNRMLWPS